ELFAGNIARDRFAADALATLGMRCQIRRDFFPGHTLVARAMHVLRTVIEHFRIVRRDCHRRNALHAINEVARGISIQRFTANPVTLLLTGLQIHHAILSFARSVDDVRVERVRHDWTSLTTWTT